MYSSATEMVMLQTIVLTSGMVSIQESDFVAESCAGVMWLSANRSRSADGPRHGAGILAQSQ